MGLCRPLLGKVIHGRFQVGGLRAWGRGQGCPPLEVSRFKKPQNVKERWAPAIAHPHPIGCTHAESRAKWGMDLPKVTQRARSPRVPLGSAEQGRGAALRGEAAVYGVSGRGLLAASPVPLQSSCRSPR